VWRSNRFAIEVDIDALGASKYRLESGSALVEGCQITIDLYPRHELTGYSLGRMLIDLREQTCWVDPDKTEITLNGELVAKTRPITKVEIDTPEFTYMAMVAGCDRGLLVYNQGVYVRNYYASHFGLNGVLNFKVQPEVNFARNDILDSCPLWKRASEALHKYGLQGITRRSRLSVPERTNVCAKLAANVLDAAVYSDLPLVRIGTGRVVSLQKLVATRLPIAAAKQDSPAGDTAHRLHKAFVVTEETISDFRCRDLDEFLKLVRNKFNLADNRFTVTTVDEVLGDDAQASVLPAETYTKRELKWLRKLVAASRVVVDSWMRHSDMMIGTSPTSRAWTDGRQYICFDRKFMRSLGWNLEGYQKACMLLFHEMSHDSDSTGNAIHDRTFYECYHDMTRAYLVSAVERMKITI